MTSFPIDSFILEKIIEVFSQTRNYVFILFPLAFLLRIAYNFILFKNASDFIDILKDSLLLVLGLYFFIDVLEITLKIPYFIAQDLSITSFKEVKLSGGFFSSKMKYFSDLLGIICYWISFCLYVGIISLLGFFSAYIIFIGTMFRFYGLLRVFFVLLFVAGLWPLIWHSINFAVVTIAVSDNAFANNVIVSSASIGKVIFPLWIVGKSSKIRALSLAQNTLAYTGSFAGGMINRGSSLISAESRQIRGSKEGFEQSKGLESLHLRSEGLIETEERSEDGFSQDFSILNERSSENLKHQEDEESRSKTIFNEETSHLEFLENDSKTANFKEERITEPRNEDWRDHEIDV